MGVEGIPADIEGETLLRVLDGAEESFGMHGTSQKDEASLAQGPVVEIRCLYKATALAFKKGHQRKIGFQLGWVLWENKGSLLGLPQNLNPERRTFGWMQMPEEVIVRVKDSL
jgi:hypothetical protein